MVCYISVFAKVECHGNSFTKYSCLVYITCHGFTHQATPKGEKLPHVIISFNKLHLEKYGLPQVMVTLMMVHPLPQ